VTNGTSKPEKDVIPALPLKPADKKENTSIPATPLTPAMTKAEDKKEDKKEEKKKEALPETGAEAAGATVIFGALSALAGVLLGRKRK